eukprot:gene33282-43035_t
MAVYMKDKIVSFLSFDIWLIGGFASLWARYLQRTNRRERKKRMSSVFVAESIHQFRDKASIDTALNSSSDHFLQQRRISLNFSVATALEKDDQLSRRWAECKQNQLPSYDLLCRHTQDQLMKSLVRHEFPLGIVLVSKSMLPADDDQGLPMTLGSIVGPRALLFLAFDYGGLLTTLILCTCATPLFVTSAQLKRRGGKAVFPDLFFFFHRARKVARYRVAEEVGLDAASIDQDYQWVVLLRTLLIIGTESLVIGFMVNLIIVAICVIFLFSGGDERGVLLILLLSILLAPFAIASSLALVIHIGRLLDLKDSDFMAIVAVMLLLRQREAAINSRGSVRPSNLNSGDILTGNSNCYGVDSTLENPISDDDISYYCSSMTNSIPEEKSSNGGENYTISEENSPHDSEVSRRISDSIIDLANFSTATSGSEDGQGEFEDVISMDSDDIAALIDGVSLEGDHDDDIMEDNNAIDIQPVGRQQWHGPDSNDDDFPPDSQSGRKGRPIAEIIVNQPSTVSHSSFSSVLLSSEVIK